ncbi:hypothetical protein [Pseudofrankia sp. BMG5.36]|uniref:hypothetical protein n=1 Tax=Pseudofrankia sp. BMG5.36 TaxID=1834512 RepID=UPI0008DA0066|nr:hypothetical protein [Pseudofrankia sp. BMG5.36]OHV47390.1 hypothetical protein BCD48_18695 [Pseudofrankia sp. BMG5.36]
MAANPAELRRLAERADVAADSAARYIAAYNSMRLRYSDPYAGYGRHKGLHYQDAEDRDTHTGSDRAASAAHAAALDADNATRSALDDVRIRIPVAARVAVAARARLTTRHARCPGAKEARAATIAARRAAAFARLVADRMETRDRS